MKPLTVAERRRLLIFALACFALISPSDAQAQNFLSGLLNWVQGNVITTLGTLAIIVVGLTMLAARAHWVTIISAMAGVWVIFNAQNLVGYFKQ